MKVVQTENNTLAKDEFTKIEIEISNQLWNEYYNRLLHSSNWNPPSLPRPQITSPRTSFIVTVTAIIIAVIVFVYKTL